MKRISLLMVLATVALANWHCKSAGRSTQKAEKKLTQRVEDRDYPSVFSGLVWHWHAFFSSKHPGTAFGCCG